MISIPDPVLFACKYIFITYTYLFLFQGMAINHGCVMYPMTSMTFLSENKRHRSLVAPKLHDDNKLAFSSFITGF